MTTRTALVVGGGLAGLTAALDLQDAGWRVTLAERRPYPGGRTFSFATAAGDQLDNGQHVILGCCSAYLELLDRLGQREKACLQERLDIRLADATDRPARLRESVLPAPFHMLPSFVRFPYLSLREKAAALWALALIGLGGQPEDESFASWLMRNGQSSNALQRFWNLITIPTCNAPAARVSAAQGAFVFREGLLRTRAGGRLGYPRVPLSQIIPEAAVERLEQRGAELRFGSTVDTLELNGAVTAAVSAQGDRFIDDAYVLAVPCDELARLIPRPWAAAASLERAPIVGINLWYDRPVFEGEVMAAIVDGQTFWLFDRTRILGLPGKEHHIAVSISAAESLMDIPRGELAGMVAEKISRALPEARVERLLRSHVEKVREATFVPSPGSARGRLSSKTPMPNLFLAGAWTNTGWPDTMEGAIRSGHEAARLAQDLVQEARD